MPYPTAKQMNETIRAVQAQERMTVGTDQRYHEDGGGRQFEAPEVFLPTGAWVHGQTTLLTTAFLPFSQYEQEGRLRGTVCVLGVPPFDPYPLPGDASIDAARMLDTEEAVLMPLGHYVRGADRIFYVHVHEIVGGTFTLTINGRTTAPLPFDVDWGTLRDALAAALGMPQTAFLLDVTANLAKKTFDIPRLIWASWQIRWLRDGWELLNDLTMTADGSQLTGPNASITCQRVDVTAARRNRYLFLWVERRFATSPPLIGSFQLQLGDYVTAPLVYDPSLGLEGYVHDWELRLALEDLFGRGNVIVTGSIARFGRDSFGWRIDFVGDAWGAEYLPASLHGGLFDYATGNPIAMHIAPFYDWPGPNPLTGEFVTPPEWPPDNSQSAPMQATWPIQLWSDLPGGLLERMEQSTIFSFDLNFRAVLRITHPYCGTWLRRPLHGENGGWPGDGVLVDGFEQMPVVQQADASPTLHLYFADRPNPGLFPFYGWVQQYPGYPDGYTLRMTGPNGLQLGEPICWTLPPGYLRNARQPLRLFWNETFRTVPFDGPRIWCLTPRLDLWTPFASGGLCYGRMTKTWGTDLTAPYVPGYPYGTLYGLGFAGPTQSPSGLPGFAFVDRVGPLDPEHPPP